MPSLYADILFMQEQESFLLRNLLNNEACTNAI